MASYTTNLNLKKPAGSENVAIGDINGNMDIIDSACANMYGITSANLTAGAKFSLSNSGTFKLGHIGGVFLTATANSSYGLSDIIATIPSNFRPKANIAALLVTMKRGSSTYIYTGIASIKSNGDITESFSSNGQNGDEITIIGIYNTI